MVLWCLTPAASTSLIDELRTELGLSRDRVAATCQSEFARQSALLDVLQEKLKDFESKEVTKAVPRVVTKAASDVTVTLEPSPADRSSQGDGPRISYMSDGASDACHVKECSESGTGDVENGILEMPPVLQRRVEDLKESTDQNHRVQSRRSSVDAVELELKSFWHDVFLSCELKTRRATIREQERRDSVLGVATRIESPDSQPENDKPPWFIIHPFSFIRIIWDMIGFLFIVFDIIFIPLQIAFQKDTEWALSQYSLLLAVVYWSSDIVFSFITGYVTSNGIVEMQLNAIARRYIRSWLALDVLIILIDLLFLALPSAYLLRMFRGLRTVRVLRLARILKMSKVSQAIGDLFTSLGIQWLTLVVAIFKTMLTIVLLTHCAGCVWYIIRYDASENVNPESSSSEYTKALYWVLGHLIAAPVDATVTPNNDAERVFTLCMIFFSLFVLGAGISKMTNTMAELNKNNEECQNARMQLQRYLRAAGAGNELAARVLRFALHAFKHRSQMTLDTSVLHLLSDNLRLELAVCQRRAHLCRHPCFKVIADDYSSCFALICAKVSTRVYACLDAVFISGSPAEYFYITSHGTFQMGTNRVLIFEEPSYFSELSLFANVTHRSTLIAKTFADAFALGGLDFADCVRLHPDCTFFVYRYAQAYLNNFMDGADLPDDKRRIDDLVPQYISEKACNVIQWEERALESVMRGSERSDNICTPDTLASQLYSDSVADEEIIEMLPKAFLECSDGGVYARLDQVPEQKRSICAIYCVHMLLQNKYAAFTQSQPPHVKLSEQTWNELQKFVRWVDLSEGQFLAMMVFLAIRGIGKIQVVSNATPDECDTPEAVVRYAMFKMIHICPSSAFLDNDQHNLVLSTLNINTAFNFAQMLQAENTPRQVWVLQDVIEKEGIGLLKFYLLGLVAVMCALGGASNMRGSTFMTEENANNVLSGVKHLQLLHTASPQSIYWGFLNFKARSLGLDFETEEQLAQTRLAALIRAKASDVRWLISDWNSFTKTDRMILVNHFLADGINETAFIFAFLPLFFANCRNNPNLNLRLALQLLILLLENLHSEGYIAQIGCNSLTIDMRELAKFAHDVVSPRLFLAVVGHVKLVTHGAVAKVVVDQAILQQVSQATWNNDPADQFSSLVTRIDKKVRAALDELNSVSV
eukprot:TRINITY_DN65034_c0_g1_i1.p1 TRINITY_DN65034_c0_g1~~TRINITY_DN65034_c0_g1_i1.p1  ORF type:complete len:1158 (+),score=208.02 TRINITY_DN65034_c0_g1_i1:109-3582(+)